MLHRNKISQFMIGGQKTKFSLDFAIVGPQRTGTTWLYEMLKQHENLHLPEGVKETMFFDRRYERGIDWYASYFKNSQEDQKCGEIAPTYFDEPSVPERLHEVNPDCDIIISLRHPAERAFSLYLHHLRKGRVPKSFWKAVREKPRIVSAGHYETHIPRWQSIFGEEQICFVFLDDIKSAPDAVLSRVFQHLEVAPLDQPEQVNESVNAASMPHSLLFARAASFLTTMLHTYGLHRVVELGKWLGLKKLAYSGAEEDMPVLENRAREQLIKEYEEDTRYVESVTERRLNYWRE